METLRFTQGDLREVLLECLRTRGLESASLHTDIGYNSMWGTFAIVGKCPEAGKRGVERKAPWIESPDERDFGGFIDCVRIYNPALSTE